MEFLWFIGHGLRTISSAEDLWEPRCCDLMHWVKHTGRKQRLAGKKRFQMDTGRNNIHRCISVYLCIHLFFACHQAKKHARSRKRQTLNFLYHSEAANSKTMSKIRLLSAYCVTKKRTFQTMDPSWNMQRTGHWSCVPISSAAPATFQIADLRHVQHELWVCFDTRDLQCARSTKIEIRHPPIKFVEVSILL